MYPFINPHYKHTAMKQILFLFLSMVSLKSFTQNQFFDLMIYKEPKGWNKEVKENIVSYSKIDNAKKTWCVIGIIRSINSKGSIKADFDSEWEGLVAKQYGVTAPPKTDEVLEAEGWEIKSGSGKFIFNSADAKAMLMTFSGHNRCISVVATTNSDAFIPEVQTFLETIDLKKPDITTNNQPNNQTTSIQPAAVDYAFHTTNFDDGWTSTVKEDWVEVTKGSIKVLLHYPKDGTIFPADPEPLTNTAWNILVAPRYSNLKDYRTAYITTYNRPYLGFGSATNNADGKEVFIVFFRQGQSGWIEFICPNKNSFIQNFKFDPYAIRWDSESDLMNPLLAMKAYNKFAIAASDFKGKWTSDFTGIQQMYHVYTGQYAGMNINQSNEEFIFNGNSYNWKLLVISGMVGSTNYNNVASSGTFTVPNNWQISFTKIEKGPKTCHAFWSCIKGARILNLLDAEYPGSGIYTQYGLSNK
jgi:hypothetical protein